MEGYFNKEQRVKIDVKSFYLSQRSGITVYNLPLDPEIGCVFP